jgi:hypothetical protein
MLYNHSVLLVLLQMRFPSTFFSGIWLDHTFLSGIWLDHLATMARTVDRRPIPALSIRNEDETMTEPVLPDGLDQLPPREYYLQ